MALYRLQYPRPLASPREAALLFQALGEARVKVYGLATRDPEKIAHQIAAVDPRYPRTLSFEGGQLTPETRAALSQLAVAGYDYLDVVSNQANLRCWPALYSWVHAKGDRAALAAALGLPRIETSFSATDLNLKGRYHDDGRLYPIDVETKHPQPAWKLFDALAGDTLQRGFIVGAQAAALAPLQRFLTSCGAEVQVDLEIAVPQAQILGQHILGATCNWQAGGVMVNFPDGSVEGTLTSSTNSDANRQKWRDRMDRAFKKAGLA